MLEYSGDGITALSMDERMTLCNMAIEAGATTGMCPVDETTIAYLRGREFAPGAEDFEQAAARWRTFVADDDAQYDAELEIDATALVPTVTWGTNPGERSPLSGTDSRGRGRRGARIHGAATGHQAARHRVGSSLYRIVHQRADRRLARCCGVLAGHKVRIPTIVTPGSQAVKRQAERKACTTSSRTRVRFGRTPHAERARAFQPAFSHRKCVASARATGTSPDAWEPAGACTSHRPLWSPPARCWDASRVRTSSNVGDGMIVKGSSSRSIAPTSTPIRSIRPSISR